MPKKDKKRKKKKARPTPHRHVLYEASVQSLEADLDFVEKNYRKYRGRGFRKLREDFCGTAALATEWVRRRDGNVSWGVDLHRPTLEWGREHRVSHLGTASRRVHLLCDDVRSVTAPKVDAVLAFNFSYSVFKERAGLREYFTAVRKSLRPGGMFFVDAFGGQETMGTVVEKRKIEATKDWDGKKVPSFTYVWDQARFNAITHEMLCHIHFHLGKGRKIRKAFTYDWRLWTLPEIREVMDEAGFSSTEVYVDGWDEEAEEGDGVYRRRTVLENQAAWVAYVVGLV
jgi:cyclopropane fatty-acyl-phospholipid synthase-like methyltransferase